MKHLKKFENFSNEEIDWRDLGRKIGVLKDPVKQKSIALDAIQKHPKKSQAYSDLLKEDPKKAEKFLDFHAEHDYKVGDILYPKWDTVKNKFVDAGISRDSTGLLGTRGFSESKKFRSKVNESFYNEPMTFGSEDHLEFCKQVEKWSKETNQPVHWDLYTGPSVTSDPATSGGGGFGGYMRDMTKSEYTPHPLSGDGKRLSQGITHNMTKNTDREARVLVAKNNQKQIDLDAAKRYWDLYVKPGKQFSIVEVDGKLIGVVHSGDMVEMAYDNMDRKFDIYRAAEALGL